MEQKEPSKSSQKGRGTRLLIGVLISVAIVALSWTHFYQDQEASVYDFRFLLRNSLFGPPEQHRAVATVDIDDLALQTYGFPFTRDRHADLVNALYSYGGRMIGFDMFFYEPSIPELPPDKVTGIEQSTFSKEEVLGLIADYDRDFLQAIQRSDIVYLAQTFEVAEEGGTFASENLRDRTPEKLAAIRTLDRFSVPLSPGASSWLYHTTDIEVPLVDLVEASEGIGFALPKPDHDGIVRRYRLALIYNGRVYFSLGLLMACDYLQVPIQKVEFVQGKYVRLPDAHLLDGTVTDMEIPVSGRSEMLVNWAGPYHTTYRHLPYNLILDFAQSDPGNRALKAVKRVACNSPEAMEDPALFLQKAREMGAEGAADDILMDMGTRVSLTGMMESSLQDNPDLTIDAFAGMLGVPDEEAPAFAEGWGGPFSEIKNNLQILKILQEDANLTLQQIGERMGVSRLEQIQYGVGVLRYLIRQGGVKPEHHPLYFQDLITSGGLHGDLSVDRIVTADDFKDTVFFYGLTATGTHDLNPQPFGPREAMLGAHVNVFNTILTQNFLRRVPWWGNAAIMLGLGLLIGFLVPRFRALPGATIIILILAVHLVGAFLLFARVGIWVDVLGPIATLVIGYLSITIYSYIEKEKEKDFVQGAFGQYLDPRVVDQLVDNPNLVNQLGGDLRLMTAYFSDVASFSTISENLTPVELVELLNEYLTEMCDIIAEYDGTIDKFEGDAVVAFWGAPIIIEDHARLAVLATIDMQNKIAEMREKWKAEGRMEHLRKIWADQGRGEFFRVRMGINTGEMVVGNMGSRTRVDYTMMGDAVNLAARLESGAKPYGIDTLISESTYLATRDLIVAREIDSIRVVGKDEPARVYEVYGRTGEVDDAKLQMVDIYGQGMTAYRVRKWDDAIAYFEEGLKLDPADGPCAVFIQRCQDYKTDPPPETWDAVYTMDSK